MIRRFARVFAWLRFGKKLEAVADNGSMIRLPSHRRMGANDAYQRGMRRARFAIMGLGILALFGPVLVLSRFGLVPFMPAGAHTVLALFGG